MWCCCAGAVICTVFPEEEKERQRLQLLAPTTCNVVVYYTLRTFFQGEFVCHIGGQLLMIYGTPDSFLYHSVYYICIQKDPPSHPLLLMLTKCNLFSSYPAIQFPAASLTKTTIVKKGRKSAILFLASSTMCSRLEWVRKI